MHGTGNDCLAGPAHVIGAGNAKLAYPAAATAPKTLPGGNWTVKPDCNSGKPITSYGRAVAPKPGRHSIPAPVEMQNQIRAALLTGDKWVAHGGGGGVVGVERETAGHACLLRTAALALLPCSPCRTAACSAWQRAMQRTAASSSTPHAVPALAAMRRPPGGATGLLT